MQTLPKTTHLEYAEVGTGQPVVLIHGSASDHRTWNQQVEILATQFRVFTYSRRYHWPNEPIADDGEYAMSDQVEDLVQLLQSLGNTPTHLVGHSYGAYLALLVAINHPKLVRSLVLAEAPVIPLFTSFPPKPQEILKLLITRPSTALPIIKFAATGLEPAAKAARQGNVEAAIAHFGKAVLGKTAFNNLSPERLQQVRTNFSKPELLSDSFMTPLDMSDVEKIATRTLLIVGEYSPALFHRLADHLERLIPDTTRTEIPNASHMMHEDNAPAFNSAVLAFLEERGPL